jgi:hypothetical protein
MKPKSVTRSKQPARQQGAESEKARKQNTPSPEAIRERAYEIHVDRGGSHGEDLDDWLRAESELEEKLRTEQSAAKISDIAAL